MRNSCLTLALAGLLILSSSSQLLAQTPAPANPPGGGSSTPSSWHLGDKKKAPAAPAAPAPKPAAPAPQAAKKTPGKTPDWVPPSNWDDIHKKNAGNTTGGQ